MARASKAGKVVKQQLKGKKVLSGAIISAVADQPVKPVPGSVPKFAPNTDGIRYWLVKSEPMKRIDARSGADVSFPLSEMLKVSKEAWTGVRNYEARNSMLQMSVGDLALFYHSNCPNPGIVGVVKIATEAQPDELQFNSKSQYFDPKSTREKPRWWCVDVSFVRRLRHKISLPDLKKNPKLQDFLLVKRGRLSVIPVSEQDYDEILEMELLDDVKDDIDCEIDQKLINL